MDTRDRRRRLIMEVLAKGPIRSQQALMALLAEQGIETTQATLSRDLRDLGIVKSPRGYIAPGAARVGTLAEEPDSAMLRSALNAYLLSADPAGNLVVCKTSPGGAMAVAVELDRHPPSGVVGTISGDDTIFVATNGPSDAKALAAWLRETAGLS